MKFKFALNQEVKLTVSDEEATVIGRAEYAHSENSYYLRYQAADGRATEAWWNESALEALSEEGEEEDEGEEVVE